MPNPPRTREEVAARVEREPPSRELDAEIERILCGGMGQLYDYRHSPSYTSSIDAALTLVPKGAGIELQRYWIMSIDAPVWSALLRIGVGGVTASAEDAPSAASALCAAALRALADEAAHG